MSNVNIFKGRMSKSIKALDQTIRILVWKQYFLIQWFILLQTRLLIQLTSYLCFYSIKLTFGKRKSNTFSVLNFVMLQ